MIKLTKVPNNGQGAGNYIGTKSEIQETIKLLLSTLKIISTTHFSDMSPEIKVLLSNNYIINKIEKVLLDIESNVYAVPDGTGLNIWADDIMIPKELILKLNKYWRQINNHIPK